MKHASGKVQRKVGQASRPRGKPLGQVKHGEETGTELADKVGWVGDGTASLRCKADVHDWWRPRGFPHKVHHRHDARVARDAKQRAKESRQADDHVKGNVAVLRDVVVARHRKAVADHASMITCGRVNVWRNAAGGVLCSAPRVESKAISSHTRWELVDAKRVVTCSSHSRRGAARVGRRDPFGAGCWSGRDRGRVCCWSGRARGRGRACRWSLRSRRRKSCDRGDWPRRCQLVDGRDGCCCWVRARRLLGQGQSPNRRCTARAIVPSLTRASNSVDPMQRERTI